MPTRWETAAAVLNASAWHCGLLALHVFGPAERGWRGVGLGEAWLLQLDRASLVRQGQQSRCAGQALRASKACCGLSRRLHD